MIHIENLWNWYIESEVLVLLYGCENRKKNIEFWNLFREIDTKGDLTKVRWLHILSNFIFNMLRTQYIHYALKIPRNQFTNLIWFHEIFPKEQQLWLPILAIIALIDDFTNIQSNTNYQIRIKTLVLSTVLIF